MISFKYRHIIKNSLAHIYIHINSNGDVLLKSSSFNARKAEKILAQKSAWVEKKLQDFKQKSTKYNIYKDGGVIYYLGDGYPLMFQDSTSKKDKIIFKDEKFIYVYHDINSCQKKVEEFYKKEAKRIFTKRVEYFSKRLNLYPKEIKFRKAKRRLGSCSYDNVLSFNYLGVKLTQREIDYIVVHELSHIKEKNHSKRFWDIVKTEFPDYKIIRKDITLSL